MFKAETLLSDVLPTSLFDCDRGAALPFLAIDEVGRGCLAGPVFVCVSFWVPQKELKNQKNTMPQWLAFVRDSKKLSPQARRLCFEHILNDFQLSKEKIPVADQGFAPIDLVSSCQVLRLGQQDFLNMEKQKRKPVSYRCLSFCLGVATANEIDRWNIWNAVQLAAGRALDFLSHRHHTPEWQQAVILMDGKIPIKVPQKHQYHSQITLVQADDLCVSVGFSSIVAKVCRDQFMEAQDFHFPQYGFFSHKGYGTKEHFSKIKSHGICPLHRQTFLENQK